MTQKEKELVLKDLCARLPYGVKIYTAILPDKPVRFNSGHLNLIGDIKILPYLRPMSSMSEEEREEWHDTFESVYDLVPGGDPDNEDDYDDNWHEQPGVESYDYLIAHHFDYRGLIPKGLALEAPENMYQI